MKAILLAMLAAGVPAAAGAADVQISVDGVRAGGTLYVSLQQRDQFLSNRQVDQRRIDNPAAGTLSVAFDDVAPGEYSVSVWHDDNGNGDLDWQRDGPPLDGWSLVNADKLTAQPTFDQVKTVVGEGATSVALTMRYGRPAAD